jgi:molybdate transport system substrate-binding protein
VVALMVTGVLAVAGCAGGDGGGSGSKPSLTVSAAASMKNAFESYGPHFPNARPRFSFAGSDELAAQIRQGVKPDVFASANTKLPDQLHRAGMVGRPVLYAGNRLVLAVPSSGSKVKALADTAKPGTKVAVGAPSVPVGSYTREVLAKLPAGERKAILGNVKSNEPDVAGVVGKVSQGAADAGFVYITDAKGAGGKIRAIELPKALQPSVEYAAAVVKGAKHPKEAKSFIDGLLSGKGLDIMRKAGFEPPPK